MTQIIIHTDGACSGNPGPGGWGAILEWNGHRKEIKALDGEKRATLKKTKGTAGKGKKAKEKLAE